MKADVKVKLEILRGRVQDYFTRNGKKIGKVSQNISHVFEASCYVLVARYYESKGYRLTPDNLQEGMFRFRFSTQGYPWNYSYFKVSKLDLATKSQEPLFEIWHNQLVGGAWSDEIVTNSSVPLFAADVAIIKAGSLPTKRPQRPPRKVSQPKQTVWVANKDLLTFAEAKNLVAYPMLLAQFYGTVHEILPAFLNDNTIHQISVGLSPVLFTDGHLTSGAQKVVSSFLRRKLRITVVPNVDTTDDARLLEILDLGLEAIDLKEKSATEFYPDF